MIAAVALVVVACAAPWAFGAVEPLWWGTMCSACLAISALSLAADAIAGPRRDDLPPATRRLAALLPIVALLGLVPIPISLRGLLAPETARLLADADPASGDVWRAISLDPRSTVGAAAVAAACASAFWLVGRAAVDERRARVIRGVVLLGGSALAAFGLVYRLWGYDQRSIYWSIQLPDVATPFGPYVNRNHFAGVMLLFLGIAAGSALSRMAAGRRAAAVPAAAVALLTAVALGATASRGAFVGLAAGAFVVVMAARRGGRVRVLVGLSALALALVGVLAALGVLTELTGRLHVGLTARESNRFSAQWDAVRVFAGSPVFGTGPGTFAAAYPPFQTIDDARTFNGAHSDWAQFLMETGLVGVAFVVLAARHLAGRLAAGAAAQEPGRWLVIGPAAGCVAMCVHGLFETNLHVPANALLFAVTLSLAFAASLRAEHPNRHPDPQDEGGEPSKRIRDADAAA